MCIVLGVGASDFVCSLLKELPLCTCVHTRKQDRTLGTGDSIY